MAKKNVLKLNKDSKKVYREAVQVLRNKYYNLFRAQFKWTGLTYRQEDYIMRKFWQNGTVIAFKIKGLDELGFCPWALQSWDMYDLPETVTLINEHGSPLIPSTVQTVDKDVCIGYIQRNKKSVFMTVDWYVERIAQVEMVINTNLQLQKMPFLIPVDENDDKIQDVVDKILNNEVVLFAQGVDPTLFKAVATSAPFIIDKLVEYKASLENELKTYLSINNSGSVQKQEQVNMDELNANNDEIMDSEQNYLTSLKEWCINIKETLNVEINVEATSAPVHSVGEYHKPGSGRKEEEEEIEEDIE